MPAFYFCGEVLLISFLMWYSMNNDSMDRAAQDHHPRRRDVWFLFVSLKCTVRQNAVKSLTSSFSAEPMLRMSLKYSSSSGNTPGIEESLSK